MPSSIEKGNTLLKNCTFLADLHVSDVIRVSRRHRPSSSSNSSSAAQPTRLLAGAKGKWLWKCCEWTTKSMKSPSSKLCNTQNVLEKRKRKRKLPARKKRKRLSGEGTSATTLRVSSVANQPSISGTGREATERPSDRAFDSNQLRIPYPLHGRRHISEKKGISSCFLQTRHRSEAWRNEMRVRNSAARSDYCYSGARRGKRGRQAKLRLLLLLLLLRQSLLLPSP